MDRRFFLRTLGLLALSTLTACFHSRDYDRRENLSDGQDGWGRERSCRRFDRYRRYRKHGGKRPQEKPPLGEGPKGPPNHSDKKKERGKRSTWRQRSENRPKSSDEKKTSEDKTENRVREKRDKNFRENNRPSRERSRREPRGSADRRRDGGRRR